MKKEIIVDGVVYVSKKSKLKKKDK